MSKEDSTSEGIPERTTVANMMAGTCAVGMLDCSLIDFLRGLKYFMDEHSRGFNPDTHLLNILRRAACVAWELEREWNAHACSPSVDEVARRAAEKIYELPNPTLTEIERTIVTELKTSDSGKVER